MAHPTRLILLLVVVFDLAGSIKDFQNAINRIDGLEFLSQFLGDGSDPDDDFHMTKRQVGRTDKQVQHSLYLVMSNAKAIDELIRLFALWQQDQNVSLAHGLGKFKDAFQQLTAIRRWGPEDRIRETGLRERWQETLDVVGQSVSSVRVEVELWYRREAAQRSAAEAHVEQIITSSGEPSSTAPRSAGSATTHSWRTCRSSRCVRSSMTEPKRSAY